ncbi:hypothetical protein BpHYR1_025139 [Brachionus plicatilis]|uniref:Uncharacterized protein n=1 Tax=Brachionus plicatilis TaxID=10195 RepID=A0A3M7RSI6_BRAPC|nr:hypothetical protein BpHYR1_025139 [Brachionus plicatilis]
MKSLARVTSGCSFSISNSRFIFLGISKSLYSGKSYLFKNNKTGVLNKYRLIHICLNEFSDSLRRLTFLSSLRVMLKEEMSTTNIIAVTPLKHWIHFLR